MTILLFQVNATSLLRVSDLQLLAPELILTVCGCLALVIWQEPVVFGHG